ncbi:hypothetical protein J3A83DRAFT_4503334 [Scleroderma citrinum]
MPGWTFNPQNNRNPPSVARLLQEFDLPTRHEAVEYKPNPWSIAKINAHLRTDAQRVNGAMETVPPAKTPSSKVVATKGPIEAAFKKQADRARTTQCSTVEKPVVEESRTKARLVYQLGKSPKDRQDLHRVAVPKQTITTSRLSSPPRTIRPELAVFPRRGVQNRARKHPDPLALPSTHRLQTGLALNAHIPISNDNHGSTKQAPPIRARTDNAMKHGHAAPLPHSLRQTENPHPPTLLSVSNVRDSAVDPVVFTGPHSAQATGIAASLADKQTRILLHTNRPGPLRPFGEAISSPNDRSRRIHLPDAHSSPGPSRAAAPYSSPARRTSHIVLPPVRTGQNAVVSPSFWEPEYTNMAPLTHGQLHTHTGTSALLLDVNHHLQNAPPLQGRTASLHMLRIPKGLDGSSSPETVVHRITYPMHVDVHEGDAPCIRSHNKRRPSPIAVPVTPVKKTRIRPPSSPPSPDRRARAVRAYAYKSSGDDEDEDRSWSTLGAVRRDKGGRPTFLSGKERGRGKNEKRLGGGMKRSGVFKLPGIGGGGRNGVSKCMDANGAPSHPKRRVITYLPPPMENQAHADVGETRRDQGGLEKCMSAKKGANIKTDRAPEVEHEDKLDDKCDYDMAVPHMDSDEITLVGEHEWPLGPESSPVPSIPFDAEQVCVRYANVRARMKEHRLLSKHFWETLKLGRFGVVWMGE